MAKIGKILVVGGIVGAGVWIWSYMKGMSTFAKNLIVKPMIGDLSRVKFELTGIQFPIYIDFGNRSSVSMTIQINALDIFYKKKILAQSVPAINFVGVNPHSSNRLNNVMIHISYTALISVIGDTVQSIIDRKDLTALSELLMKMTVSCDLTVNNAVQTPIMIDLSTGTTSMGGLGLVAASSRKIRPRSDYQHLIPSEKSLSYADPIITPDVSTEDTVIFMKKIAKQSKNDTRELAQSLAHRDVRQTLQNIFDFVYNYIQYVPDSATKEQVRRPLRTLYDQAGDCDCYSVLIGSILENLGIPYKFRIAAYAGRDYYQHVYVVVPTKEYGELVCDPVIDRCFQEKKTSKQKDF